MHEFNLRGPLVDDAREHQLPAGREADGVRNASLLLTPHPPSTLPRDCDKMCEFPRLPFPRARVFTAGPERAHLGGGASFSRPHRPPAGSQGGRGPGRRHLPLAGQLSVEEQRLRDTCHALHSST